MTNDEIEVIKRHQVLADHLDAIREIYPDIANLTLVARKDDGGLLFFLSDDELPEVIEALNEARSVERTATPIVIPEEGMA